MRWDSRILTPIAPSGISTGKKWRDRLSYLRFGIQKIQGFSESDRRGVTIPIRVKQNNKLRFRLELEIDSLLRQVYWLRLRI